MGENLQGLEAADQEWYLLGFKNGEIVSIDGGHSKIEGAVKARKILLGIFGAERYSGVEWRACYFVPVPDIDVPVNEEAIAACKMMVDRTAI